MTTTLLNPCIPYKKPSLLQTGIFLASLAGLLAPSLTRADVTVSVDKGQNASQHKVSAPAAPPSGGGGGYGGGKGGGGSKTVTDTVSGSIFYTIAVRNISPNPVSGVTIEYHVYNKTTTSGGGVAPTITIDDITGTSTIDLPGNGTKPIETSDITTGSSNTLSQGSKGKKGGGSTASASSTVTGVMGWVIYIKKGDKIIHTVTSDDSIIDKVAQWKAKGGG